MTAVRRKGKQGDAIFLDQIQATNTDMWIMVVHENQTRMLRRTVAVLNEVSKPLEKKVSCHPTTGICRTNGARWGTFEHICSLKLTLFFLFPDHLGPFQQLASWAEGVSDHEILFSYPYFAPLCQHRVLEKKENIGIQWGPIGTLSHSTPIQLSQWSPYGLFQHKHMTWLLSQRFPLKSAL